MDEKQQLALGGVRRPILGIVFYVVAGLIGVAGLVIIVVRSSIGISTGSVWLGGIWVVIVDALLGVLMFWALGAVISYLHDTREYMRIIAQRLPDPSKRSEPSEN